MSGLRTRILSLRQGDKNQSDKDKNNAKDVRGGDESICLAAQLLGSGSILAVKGLGGYHLVCDASNAASVAALRERKFRKEKPFAIMARDINIANDLVDLSAEAEKLLTSTARPIVLAPSKASLNRVAPGVAPENSELGVMLPYTPLHHLLFAADAPEVLVMTSANRSSEPIAYEDEEAIDRLSGIADAFLIGERPIARRVDDSWFVMECSALASFGAHEAMPRAPLRRCLRHAQFWRSALT